MKTTNQIFHEANTKIGEVRLSIMQEIERILPTGKIHTFNPDTSGLCINIEEEGLRLQAVSMNNNEIKLEDESTIDIGEIGTDDLLTILDTLNEEINFQ